MPTYDYQCPSGHKFEKIHKMSESPRVRCPICGKPAARQISGGAGLVFKGSGFYITDYGKDGKGARKAESAEASPSAAAAPAADAAKSEAAKPDTSEKKPPKPAAAKGPKKAAE